MEYSKSYQINNKNKMDSIIHDSTDYKKETIDPLILKLCHKITNII